MESTFQNKTVLITGSSSGIGRATALFFASKGAKLVLASRNTSSNEELLGEIKSAGGIATFVKTNIAKADEVRRMVDTATNAYGTIDIAVNNAGIEGTPGVKTTDYEEAVWDQVIDVNLKGVWLSMKYEIPVMLKAGKGVIINISSLAGIKAGGAGVGYHAAKFGAVGLTKSAALEYAGDNIRINVICPAVIETPMADRAFDSPAKLEAAVNMHPIGRFGTVDEVVNTISWLACDESSFITGATIPVDGGASL